MPYSVTIKPPVVFVAWRGFSAGDLREIADRLAEMRRTTGRPAVYLSLIPADPHSFTDEDQKVLVGFLNGILPSCATVHHVIEGDGFVKSARLAFVTNLAAATPRRRDFHVHATLEEGFRSIKALYGVDLRTSETAKLERFAPSTTKEVSPERASAVFRGAARIVDAGRGPPRKGS